MARKGYIVVSRANEPDSLKHWGIGNPFKESAVKRDAGGQFSSSSGAAKGIVGGKMIPGVEYHLINGMLVPEVAANSNMKLHPNYAYELHKTGKGDNFVPVSSSDKPPHGTWTNNGKTMQQHGSDLKGPYAKDNKKDAKKETSKPKAKASILDGVQNILDQRARMKNVEGARKISGNNHGRYYNKEELDYVKGKGQFPTY